ncbi:MAG: type II CAAX endopeptidase family protein [Bacteroidota bacterium]
MYFGALSISNYEALSIMQKTARVLLISLLAFGGYMILSKLFFRDWFTWMNDALQLKGTSYILTYIGVGFPIIAGTLILHRGQQFLGNLGLNASILRGGLFALLCTLPMFIGFAIVFEFNTELTAYTILTSVIAAGFFEELYFRGFLFGQVFRNSRLGFILSVILGALIFGSVHLYQGNSLGESTGIFMVTFMGGVLFAWVYAEWDFNLWTSIFLHMFMNLAWGLFSAGSNALGSMYSNIFRVLTIALAIILTIRYKRRKGLKLAVNRKTLLLKSEDWEGLA